MARIRSPNYPHIGLPDAIAKVKVIHDKERHLAAPKEVIAKHLGYGGLNGASNRIISALLKYGLLDEASNDALRVSEVALSILYPKDPEQKALAVAQAAYGPPLFAEIHSEWDGQPSDENLKAFLVRKNFADDAIDSVIAAYRETIELVARESQAYSGGSRQDVGGSKQKEAPAMQEQQQPAGGGQRTAARGPMNVSFSGDKLEVSAELRDAEAVDKLIEALKATKTLLPDKKDPSQS